MLNYKLTVFEVMALAAASLIAAAWYFIASFSVMPESHPMIAVGGAVLLSAFISTVAVRQVYKGRFQRIVGPMRQKLDAHESHAMISMADGAGRLTVVNDQFAALTGYSRETLVGQPVWNLYPESALTLVKHIREQLKSGKKWQGETPLMHACGRTIYTQTTILPIFDHHGTMTGTISVRTDTTHVNKLRAERHTMEALSELRDDIWIIENATWKFTYMNLAACTRMGWSPDEFSEKCVDDVLSDPCLAQILEACRKMEGCNTSTRFEITHKDVPLHVNIKFLCNAEGIGRFLVLLSDVTEQRRQDGKISEFVSTVSHELRSPLTSIKGALRLLLATEKEALSDNGAKLLEIAHRSSDRLILIINDILDLEKITNGEMQMQFQDTDLSELVEETYRAMPAENGRTSRIDIVGADIPHPIRTDSGRIIQVLTNLLSNACKFSPPDGRIIITIEEEPDCFRVTVQDEGAGIPAKDHYKIFQRFADMENSDRLTKGGTGLGLSICKAIVETLGGSIGFQTREGAGSSFYFTLPRNLGADVAAMTIAAQNQTLEDCIAR